ncbi:antibiotic biosynthesis monooxygenase [Chitinophagaceae bacterium IBVUCB1]|nr:antibiotic biosynthesis monooxygenase [Chitinophagaceae bacterium IBVUCB1]
MIVRIVQMTFEPTHIDAFLQLFDERKERIRHFEGCTHLELWQDAHAANIFFTYSMWQSEEHLNHYRFSELFKDTWARTKALFADKPQAWSVNRKMLIE